MKRSSSGLESNSNTNYNCTNILDIKLNAMFKYCFCDIIKTTGDIFLQTKVYSYVQKLMISFLAPEICQNNNFPLRKS